VGTAAVLLSEARTRAPDKLLRRIVRLEVVDDSHRMTIGKSRQGDLLDRSALPEPRETRVMHDPTAADVHPMMVVSTARSRQMGAERRLVLESYVMRYQMRVDHRRFPSIGGRVRVD
jgi:hypothetical protein